MELDGGSASLYHFVPAINAEMRDFKDIGLLSIWSSAPSFYGIQETGIRLMHGIIMPG